MEGNIEINSKSSPEVKLNTQQHGKVVIDNGIVQVTFLRPQGNVVGITYNGMDNVLESRNEPTNRGYIHASQTCSS